MCGIAGLVGNGKIDFDLSSTIQDMTNSMAHRGPDDRGHVILSYDDNIDKNYVAFGHRRLKIIDLSDKAHQPMLNPRGDIAITYNGEIYNYLELKNELIKKGYSFISTSDTEVILKSYKEWGIDCFERFNGMWALAIFDKKRRKVILSRDRLGKKPLYYYKTQDLFIFASEIKAILKHPLVIKEPNYEKIFRYIATHYRYVDIDQDSYFKGIYQVPKSSVMEIGENFDISSKPYWVFGSGITKGNITDSQAIEGFRDLFFDSVKIRLRSDVPVGCMLSGGLDSTAITSVAYKVLKHPIATFSGITGQEKGVYDESEYIDEVVKETGANFHYIRPDSSDIFETIGEMLYFHDEPVCTVTWHSLYLIAKKVKFENTPVVLNGHGGDELLAGYWDHYQYNFYDMERESNPEALEDEIKLWKINHGRDPSEIENYKKYINELMARKVNEMQRFPDYSDCFKPDFSRKFKKDIEWKNPFRSMLSKRLYSELMFETVPASLRPEDRNTMAHSIESRSPFLDYRLIEYCFSLPNRFKIRNGLGKWLSRQTMRGILPEKVRTRKDKAGFISPADEWFRTINRKQIFDLINSESFKDRGIFNIERINQTFREHLKKEKNHQMFLWQIINLELWFRRFFDE